MNSAVFLDRDGTVTEEVGYLTDLRKLRLIPGAGAAIKKLNQTGFKVVLVTNQSGVARGFFSESLVGEAHARLELMLQKEGARLDGVYFCPHHPTAGYSKYTVACDCRKPGTGLIQRAAKDLDIDIKRSYVVGDKWSDVELAQRAGARSILVKSGFASDDPGNIRPQRLGDPDFTAHDINEAADWIMRHDKKDSRMNLSAKKILVMRYRFIGDTVLTVPFIRNLREAYPSAHIDLMLEPFSGRVIEGCPYVDRVIPFEFKTIHTYSSRSQRNRISAYLHYWNQIRKENYDAAFVLKRSLSSALIVWAARVPRRIGFGTEGRGFLLTDPVPYRRDRHEVENFLDCLRAIDIPIRSTSLELWPAPDDERKISAIFADAGWKANDLKIVIHAAASLPAKQWPLDRFSGVMKLLKDRYSARFIYTGAPEDTPLYQEIEKLGTFNGLNLCGVTTLRENISVYRAADLFFGVDSGPMHMAAAAGIPVVALFGPTDERKWGPWGEGHVVITKRLSCHPCKPHKCKDNECMRRTSVEEAFAAVENKIKKILPKVLHD